MDGNLDPDGCIQLVVSVVEQAVADVGDERLPLPERLAAQHWLRNGGTTWAATILNVDADWLGEQVALRLDAEPLIEDDRIRVGDGVEQYMLAGFETIC